MAYEIKLVKLITGEMIIGKFGKEEGFVCDVATLQSVPTQQGVQMMLLPYGYPFEQDIEGKISTTHILYEYKDCPDELKNKYMEASSNLTLSTGGLGGGMGGLNLGGEGGNVSDISSLLKK